MTIGSGVTSIGREAFYDCSSLTSITLPFVGAKKYGTENTYFGYIFGASKYSENAQFVPESLKTVVLTGGSIGSSAFSGCRALQSITIPNSVTSIGSSAFSGCSALLSITIPNSVTTIEDWAFSGCGALTSVTIGSGVTSIGFQAFNDCFALSSVHIKDLAAWCNIAFDVSTSSSYNFEAHPLYYAHNLYLNDELIAELTIPNSVTYIRSYAFYDCRSLTSVTIGNSVTSIGHGAFEGCDKLQSMTLPFVGAKKDGTQNTYFGYIFGASEYSENSSYVPVSLKTVVITGGTIGDTAFSGCSSLTTVTIGSGVTSIGSYAFKSCSSLTSVTIPDSVTSIGWGAFEYSSLTSVTIGSGVTSIGDYAFRYCYKLVEVYNLSSLNIVAGSSNYGYVGCYAKNVYTPNSGESKLTTTDDGFVFYSDNNGEYCLIGYNGTATELVLPDNFNGNSYYINQYAFSGCSSLTILIIGSDVTSIGEYAFSGCSKLKEVYYAGSVSDWTKISIGGSNNSLAIAARYYYSEAKPKPTTSGKYWHYGADGVTVVKW